MAKRNATTDLNHDNWDQEEEVEEAGVFQQASKDVIKNRTIRIAKRKLASDSSESKLSPFAAFSGFTTAKKPATDFSFLASGSSSKPPNPPDLQTPPKSEKKKKSEGGSASEYENQLRGLNKSVSAWIKQHVDRDPLCILTPIFSDYERHLLHIQTTYKSASPSSSATSTSPAAPLRNGGGSEDEEEEKEVEEEEPKSSFLGAKKVTFAGSEGGFSFGGKSNAALGPVGFTFKKTEEKTVEDKTDGSTIVSSFSLASAASASHTGFSFGSGKPFTFSNVSQEKEKQEAKSNEEDSEDEQPAQNDFSPVVEDDALYSKRCKMYVKSGDSFKDRGVGTFYVKKVDEKIQLVIRADTSLGLVLMNTLLKPTTPLQRQGTNNILMVCIPDQTKDDTPATVLLRVKTSQDADEMYAKLQELAK